MKVQTNLDEVQVIRRYQFNNVFGNTNRFTDVLGTQIYANNVVLDHSTYDQVGETIRAYSQNTLAPAFVRIHIDNQPYTLGGFNNWMLVTSRQLHHLFDTSIFRDYLNFPPFNHSVSSTPNRIWTRTPESASVFIQYSGTALIVGNANAGYRTFTTRLYTLAELGL